MKSLLFFFTLCLSLSGLRAQEQLPNSGFENWSNAGGFFNPYQDPDNWNTVNSATSSLGVFTATRATASAFVYSGQSALKLETRNLPLVNQVVPGLCVIGDINIDEESVEGGISFTSRPLAINGWFQYYPAGIDTGQIGLFLTRWNDVTGTRDTIGTGGFWALGQTSSYTFFSGPVEYFSDENPDTIQVALVSSSAVSPRAGSELYIDALSLEYIVTDLIAAQGGSARVFPNPADSEIWFEVSGARAIEAYSQNGRLAASYSLSEGQQNINLGDLARGYYVLRFLDQGRSIISHARIILGQ